MEGPDDTRAAKQRTVSRESGEQGSTPVLVAAASECALRSTRLLEHLSKIAQPEREEIERFLSLAQPLLPLLVAGPTVYDEICLVRQVVARRAPGATCAVVSADNILAIKDLLVVIRSRVQTVTTNTFKLPGTKPRDMRAFLEKKHIETKLQQNLILIVENFDKFVGEFGGRMQPKLTSFLQFFSALMVQSPRFKMIVKLQSAVLRDRLFPLFEDPVISPSYTVTFPEFSISTSINLFELGVGHVLKESYANAPSPLVAPRVLELVVRKTIAGSDVGYNMRLAVNLLVRTAEQVTANEQLIITMKDVLKAIRDVVTPLTG